MFTKADFFTYFEEIETFYKKAVISGTDLLNVLDHKEIKNKMNAILQEDMEMFRALKVLKKSFQ